MRHSIFFLLLGIFLPAVVSAQCGTCGNGVVDAGETNVICPQDVAHDATCTSPCAQPTSFETTAGIRQTFDFSGTTTWTTAGLPAGWTFAGAPTPTTAGALPAADAYGAKAGLIQPNCSGSCAATNGFCIGNLANLIAVGGGGASGKLGANFDGRPNIAQNLSYAVLRGQSNPTLVSPTFDMSAVNGFKVQLWLFPSETSCGQLNSWGSCVGNECYLDFSTNGGTSWSQILIMNLNSGSSDMCTFNSSNTLWLSEGRWSRVCLTVFRNAASEGNFYPAATATTAASGMMMNSAFFTANFKFRVRYSQTASCTAGITATNPGRYLAIDYPTITSGDEMIPCGISFANLCGYGADDNDDGVGSTGTSTSIAFGTVRRGVNHAERGVEILTSQTSAFASQNLSGSAFATNFDLCNAEGGDKQCIDWQTNNNFYTVVYECIADWEAPTGATGINVQYYKGTTPSSTGMSKVTAAGKTAEIGWRYSANRFVSCSSLSDLNPGCNGYSFLSASLPTQFARGFYALSINSLGRAWPYYGASSCNHYFNGPFFAPIAIPDTLTGSGNYVICNGSNELVFTGLSQFCSDASGLSGSGSLTITGPNSFSDVITSGGQGTVPIVDAGTYTITASTPATPAQCVNCGRVACITVSAAEISSCGPLSLPEISFTATLTESKSVELTWHIPGWDQYTLFILERRKSGEPFTGFKHFTAIPTFANFSVNDDPPGGGEWEYRMKLHQRNGTHVYSDHAKISLPFDDGLKIWPIPATQTLTLEAEAMQNGFSVSILTAEGREWKRFSSPDTRLVIPVSEWPAGIYIAKVSDGTSAIQKKFVIIPEN